MLPHRPFLAAVATALLLVWTPPSLAAPFVDAAGRTVDLPDRVARVVAAGPPASTILYTIAPEKLLGWVRKPSAEEREFLAPPYADLPTIGRLTGKGNTAKLEDVVAMRPDMIIDVGSIDATYASLADRVQAQTGIPYVLLDGRLANTPETYRRLGKILGTPERGEELAAYAETVLAEAAATASAHREKPTRVYYGRGPEGLETGLGGSINMEALEMIGAENVAAVEGSGGLATVSPEQVLAWKPDAIIVADRSALDAIRSDPIWANLAAVREGRVVRAPSLPFGWFDSPPGVNRLIGLKWLATVLYPGSGHGELRETTRVFYDRFYHVALSDERLDGLLRDTIPKTK